MKKKWEDEARQDFKQTMNFLMFIFYLSFLIFVLVILFNAG